MSVFASLEGAIAHGQFEDMQSFYGPESQAILNVDPSITNGGHGQALEPAVGPEAIMARAKEVFDGKPVHFKLERLFTQKTAEKGYLAIAHGLMHMETEQYPFNHTVLLAPANAEATAFYVQHELLTVTGEGSNLVATARTSKVKAPAPKTFTSGHDHDEEGEEEEEEEAAAASEDGPGAMAPHDAAAALVGGVAEWGLGGDGSTVPTEESKEDTLPVALPPAVPDEPAADADRPVAVSETHESESHDQAPSKRGKAKKQRNRGARTPTRSKEAAASPSTPTSSSSSSSGAVLPSPKAPPSTSLPPPSASLPPPPDAGTPPPDAAAPGESLRKGRARGPRTKAKATMPSRQAARTGEAHATGSPAPPASSLPTPAATAEQKPSRVVNARVIKGSREALTDTTIRSELGAFGQVTRVVTPAEQGDLIIVHFGSHQFASSAVAASPLTVGGVELELKLRANSSKPRARGGRKKKWKRRADDRPAAAAPKS